MPIPRSGTTFIISGNKRPSSTLSCCTDELDTLIKPTTEVKYEARVLKNSVGVSEKVQAVSAFFRKTIHKTSLRQGLLWHAPVAHALSTRRQFQLPLTRNIGNSTSVTISQIWFSVRDMTWTINCSASTQHKVRELQYISICCNALWLQLWSSWLLRAEYKIKHILLGKPLHMETEQQMRSHKKALRRRFDW